MERWQGKVCVITGASVGIGAAIAVELTKAGLIVIGLARRPKKILELRSEIPSELRENLHGLECDVSNEENIINVFKTIDNLYGGISILVNNAGVLLEGRLLERESSKTLKKVLDVNLLGLINCTREAYLSMKQNGINDGHIIHINSILGHSVPYSEAFRSHINVYGASKYAITALTEVHRQDLYLENTNIKVTSISPGIVKTDMTDNCGVTETYPCLNPEDIADAVLFAISTPPHVQIQEMIIKPLGEPF